MAYTAVPTKSPGDTWTASEHNTYVRDNFAAGVPDIFEAKGDIAVGTAANAATRVPVLSTNGYVLIADSSRTSGVKWGLDPVQDLVTTKGDILVGSAADTLIRQAVGADNFLLQADSTKTSGITWSSIIPAVAYARYYKSRATSIANNSVTILNYDTEDYDTVSGVTTGAAWKFTANSTTAGYYLVTAMASFRATSVWGANEQAGLFLYKNDAQYQVLSRLFMHAAGGYRVSVNGAGVVNLADTDYIDIRVYQNSGNALSIQSTGTISHVALARVF